MIPVLALLLAVNPSDISGADLPVSADTVCRIEHAIRWKTPPMTDATCARIANALTATPTPRLLLAMFINESDLRPFVIAYVSETVSDRGLGGVRCVVGEKGKCINGPAREYTPTQLLDPVINIAVSNEILVQKGYNLRSYNGGIKAGLGYRARIEAIVGAIDGVVVPSKLKRIRKLTSKIVAVLTLPLSS